jgi:toxin FitB
VDQAAAGRRGRRLARCRRRGCAPSQRPRIAEIRLGIELLPQGRKRSRLRAWLDDDLAARFEGRIIDIDRAIAEAWAQIVAYGRARGARPPVLDAFLAATALVHVMTLVTRNERDLADLDVPVLNPWQT